MEVCHFSKQRSRVCVIEITFPSFSVLQIIAKGEVNRHVGHTKMNAESSRSHSILRLVIESKKLLVDEEVPVGEIEAPPLDEATKAANTFTSKWK